MVGSIVAMAMSPALPPGGRAPSRVVAWPRVADVSVRPARPADAERVARVQQETWLQAYADLLPARGARAARASGPPRSGSRAVERPPTPRHRLLVAMDGDELVGFAAERPDEDLEGAVELVSLLVLPRWGRRGHGSRLLAARVADWQEDGRTLALCWAFERDPATQAFLRGAGWEPDGATRGLDTGEQVLRQVRYHVDVTRVSGFDGFPEAALDFYEGLEADNSKAYWTDHKARLRRRGPGADAGAARRARAGVRRRRSCSGPTATCASARTRRRTRRRPPRRSATTCRAGSTCSCPRPG